LNFHSDYDDGEDPLEEFLGTVQLFPQLSSRELY